MAFLRDQYVLSPYGSFRIPSDISSLGAGLEGVGEGLEKIAGAKKGREAREFISGSDAPDWIKALGEYDPKQAVETYGQYKTALSASATSFARQKELEHLKHQYNESELTLRGQIENSNAYSQIVNNLISDITKIEHESKVRQDEMKLRSSLNADEENVKLQQLEKLSRQHRESLSKAIYNYAPALGISDINTKKFLAEVALSGNLDKLEAIKRFIPELNTDPLLDIYKSLNEE